MPYSLDNKLVIGISSQALFDLDEANAVYLAEGLETYPAVQRVAGGASQLGRQLPRVQAMDSRGFDLGRSSAVGLRRLVWWTVIALAATGCVSRVEVRVENLTDTPFLVALRGEDRGIWEATGGAVGDITVTVPHGSVLLLVLTQQCEITARYGLSSGDSYDVVIGDGGEAELSKSDVALTGVPLPPSAQCP